MIGNGMIIDEIRKARESKGLSRRALAEMLDVDPQAIVRLEAGTGSIDLLIRVMDAVDFHVAGLAPGRSLPDQLRNRRIRMELSVAELSRRAGLSRNTIAGLEAGKGTIRALESLLAIIGKQARRRAPERQHWAADRKGDRDSRFTPLEFLEPIYKVFGIPDLDPCGHDLAPVRAAQKYMLSEGRDGLAEPWAAGVVWCNPPFSAQLQWLRKADHEVTAGNAKTVICLVPARTDSTFFHDCLIGVADIGLLRGRIKFLSPDGRAEQTPFALMLVIFGATARQLDHLRTLIPAFWLPRSALATDESDDPERVREAINS